MSSEIMDTEHNDSKFFVTLYAPTSGMYLCFNKRWKLVGRKRKRGSMCLFKEIMVNGYVRFRSAVDKEKFIGFYKKGGRPIRYQIQQNVLNKNCLNFYKRKPNNMQAIEQTTSSKTAKSHSLSIHNTNLLSNRTNSVNKISTSNLDSNNSKNTTVRSKHKRKKSSNKSIFSPKTTHSSINAGSLENSNQNIPPINDLSLRQILSQNMQFNENINSNNNNQNNNQQRLLPKVTNNKNVRLQNNSGFTGQKQQSHKIRHSHSRHLRTKKSAQTEETFLNPS